MSILLDMNISHIHLVVDRQVMQSQNSGRAQLELSKLLPPFLKKIYFIYLAPKS